MNKLLATFCLILLGCCTSGCATPYRVQVNGYTDPNTSAPLAPGGSFFVIENKDAQNPLLEKEIAGKIQKLLGNQGYRLDAYEKVDYYLFFGYGIGQDRNVSVVMPDYYPWGGWGFGVGSGAWKSSYFVVAPFFSYGYPYTETIYDRWLLLNVVDGKYYREKGEFRTLWVGEARSAGTSADLRTVINYMLLASFREFGKNTGKAVSVEINEQSPEVYGLTK